MEGFYNEPPTHASHKEEAMGRVTVIGSSNIDLVIKSPELPSPGETVLGGDFFQAFGGKGANQAVASARAGADTAFIGCVGDDAFGTQMRENLSADGIDVSGEAITVSYNQAFGNREGLVVYGTNSSRAQVTGNVVHDNTARGIRAWQYVDVVDNRVYGHLAYGGSSGIHSDYSTTVLRANVVYDNSIGLDVSRGHVTSNRLYNNTVGIAADYSPLIERNWIQVCLMRKSSVSLMEPFIPVLEEVLQGSS